VAVEEEKEKETDQVQRVVPAEALLQTRRNLSTSPVPETLTFRVILPEVTKRESLSVVPGPMKKPV
jgi:hypothetical protein